MEEPAHRALFESLDTDRDGRIYAWELLAPLGQAGIQPSDPRLKPVIDGLTDLTRPPVPIDYDRFTEITQYGDGVVERALQGELAVSTAEFAELRRGVERIYADLEDNREGEVAQYIPTLKNADPERFGIAICTADGQLFEIGDTRYEFSVQSTSKPFSYAMALEELGADEVHRWVGQEQSGGTFNDYKLSLDAERRPLNPMINAGAIATLALVDSARDESTRMSTVKGTWDAMMGRKAGSDVETFLAERATGHGNRGLANLMAAEDMLRARSPEQAAEFYFQVCSLELDAARLAAAGATLANRGVAPYSGQRVFSPDTTGRVLSVMGHSGMYDDSGKFADLVGLPAKSGVSGNVMLVVPNKGLAVVTFSPRLDRAGNSVRGVEVCRRLADEFGLHPYKGRGPQRARHSVADRKAQTAVAFHSAFEGRPEAGRPATAPANAPADGARTVNITLTPRETPGRQA
jgi:glutaminase